VFQPIVLTVVVVMVTVVVARYAERTNIEIELFNIQTKLRAAKQKNWYPPEGKLVSDINKVGLRRRKGRGGEGEGAKLVEIEGRWG